MASVGSRATSAKRPVPASRKILDQLGVRRPPPGDRHVQDTRAHDGEEDGGKQESDDRDNGDEQRSVGRDNRRDADGNENPGNSYAARPGDERSSAARMNHAATHAVQDHDRQPDHDNSSKRHGFDRNGKHSYAEKNREASKHALPRPHGRTLGSSYPVVISKSFRTTVAMRMCGLGFGLAAVSWVPLLAVAWRVGVFQPELERIPGRASPASIGAAGTFRRIGWLGCRPLHYKFVWLLGQLARGIHIATHRGLKPVARRPLSVKPSPHEDEDVPNTIVATSDRDKLKCFAHHLSGLSFGVDAEQDEPRSEWKWNWKWK